MRVRKINKKIHFPYTVLANSLSPGDLISIAGKSGYRVVAFLNECAVYAGSDIISPQCPVTKWKSI